MSSISLYRRMLKYLWVYRSLIAVSLLLSLLVVSFEGLSLWFSASLVQTLFSPEAVEMARPEFSLGNINQYLKYWTYQLISKGSALDSLKLVCAMMAATFFLKNLFIYLKKLVMTRINLLVIRDMRDQLYSHVLKLPVSYYDKTKSGDVISLIQNDVQNINASMTGTFDKVFIEPMRVIFFISMLFIINYKLTLAVFLVFPVLGLMITFIGKAVRRRSRRVLEHMAGLLSILHETIGGIRIVKMFGMHDSEAQKFGKENKKFILHSYRSTAIGAVSSPLTELMGVVVVIILLWYGGRQVLTNGGFGAEDFVRFLIFLFSTFTPLKAISNLNSTLQRGFAAADRVFSVLDAPTEPTGISGAVKPEFKKQISFSHVHFTYPECGEKVLDDISFTIKKGSIAALVGSSGSGKSTILDLLPRFYDVTEGSVSIDNTDIREIQLDDLRKLFGIVSQETFLFNETIFRNICYGVQDISENRVIEAAKAANAWEFIEKLPRGMRTVIGERGVMLSGGQRQRISIARALLRNPPILILDEATSSLDTESERLVQSAINNVIESRTALVVAHRLSTIQHADLILVLEKGRIVEKGSHEELLANNHRYKYFHDIQFAPAEQ
ncbi:MAG: ABC transporter ATP-binding protein [Chitinispirillaceae bacterium]